MRFPVSVKRTQTQHTAVLQAWAVARPAIPMGTSRGLGQSEAMYFLTNPWLVCTPRAPGMLHTRLWSAQLWALNGSIVAFLPLITPSLISGRLGFKAAVECCKERELGRGQDFKNNNPNKRPLPSLLPPYLCFSTIEMCWIHTHTCDWQARWIHWTNPGRNVLIG